MKKVISIVLCVMIAAFCLVGCQSNEEAAAESSAAATPEATTEASAATTEAAGEGTAQASAASPGDGGDITSKINPEGTKYKIALSNSYMGNDWRQQMQRIAEYVATQEPYASRCELTMVNCENSAEAQAASIDALVQQGYDAILVDPASETGVSEAIARAADAGVLVVTFDQPCDSDVDYSVNIDAGWGFKVMATWMAESMGGEGNVVLDQGLPGAALSELIYTGAEEVFNTYDGITIVSDYISNYAEADGESALSSVIAANSDIDCVLTQGYTTSVSNAFKKAGSDKIPVSCGNNYNGNMLDFLENGSEGILYVYCPGISASALNYAIRILDGEAIDREISLLPDFLATSDDYDLGEYSNANIEVIEEGVNCFSDQASGLQWPAVTSDLGIEVPMEVVLGE